MYQLKKMFNNEKYCDIDNLYSVDEIYAKKELIHDDILLTSRLRLIEQYCAVGCLCTRRLCSATNEKRIIPLVWYLKFFSYKIQMGYLVGTRIVRLSGALLTCFICALHNGHLAVVLYICS